MKMAGNKGFDVGGIHFVLKRFDLQTRDLVQKICEENVEKIIEMWGLNLSKKRRIDIYYIRTALDELFFLFATILGGLIVKIIFPLFIFLYRTLTIDSKG